MTRACSFHVCCNPIKNTSAAPRWNCQLSGRGVIADPAASDVMWRLSRSSVPPPLRPQLSGHPRADEHCVGMRQPDVRRGNLDVFVFTAGVAEHTPSQQARHARPGAGGEGDAGEAEATDARLGALAVAGGAAHPRSAVAKA